MIRPCVHLLAQCALQPWRSFTCPFEYTFSFDEPCMNGLHEVLKLEPVLVVLFAKSAVPFDGKSRGPRSSIIILLS